MISNTVTRPCSIARVFFTNRIYLSTLFHDWVHSLAFQSQSKSCPELDCSRSSVSLGGSAKNNKRMAGVCGTSPRHTPPLLFCFHSFLCRSSTNQISEILSWKEILDDQDPGRTWSGLSAGFTTVFFTASQNLGALNSILSKSRLPMGFQDHAKVQLESQWAIYKIQLIDNPPKKIMQNFMFVT